MTENDLIALLDYLAKEIHDSRESLSALDRDIGDGDHGVTMDIGWRAIQKEIHELKQPNFYEIFQGAGRSFLRHVGATVGPLYATMFFALAKLTRDHEILTTQDAGALFTTAVEALQQRSKAEVGDKTMMDVWIPALEAFQRALSQGPNEAATAALMAAEKGVNTTKDLTARKGRASHLGHRTVGHIDPGAQSAWILLRSTITWLRNNHTASSSRRGSYGN
jgi:dihydroxyacetone kinase-like protein